MPSSHLSPLRLTIDRRRAEFADPEFEDRFVRHFLPERNAQLKASLLFSAFFYIVFGVTDLTTLGLTATAWVMVALRVVVGIGALAGYVAVSRNPDSVRVSIRTTCAVLVLGLAVFPVLCWYQPSAMAWNLMSFALILMAVYVNFPNRFMYAVAIGVGASVEFAAMLMIQDSLLPEDLLALVLMLILGNALGYIAASRFNLAQREQFRSSMLLQQLADRDPLTGCYNRRVLQSGLLDAELARSRRYGTALSVIMCDIDHFKRINDSYGHAAGDQVLSGFAGLLQSMARETDDSVIRYGGEEFLVVLPQAELAEAQSLAERIRHAFANTPTPIGGGAYVSATASFGIACVPTLHDAMPDKFDALIETADIQLYAVKREGRNGVRGAVVGATADAPPVRA
ncbi:GGDEF domain-containing protein [Massilia sp. ST3]|uniref:GGDEF domain-containing protein n=1 Tax=Massilia sp. ST3 TaxID=2824903 RepID=UPI001B81A02C|nr:GGDEF domain-containing protein [Massilia sp. ST3]